jgi:hypothetical protein
VAVGSLDALEHAYHAVVLLGDPDMAVPVWRAYSPKKPRKQGQSALVKDTQMTCLAGGRVTEVLYIAHLHFCPKAGLSA